MQKLKEIPGNDPDIVAVIYQDDDAQPPEDDIVKIAYTGHRNTLGNQHCTRAGLDDIRRGIDDGTLVGVPVWAYVHSGATISTGTKLRGGTQARLRENPFHCAWDSGQSGFAYMTHADALREWGNKRLSPQQRDKAHHYIDAVVEEFDLYLRGESYGYMVERLVRDADGDEIERLNDDSCWGFYGEKAATEAAQEALVGAGSGTV